MEGIYNEHANLGGAGAGFGGGFGGFGGGFSPVIAGGGFGYGYGGSNLLELLILSRFLDNGFGGHGHGHHGGSHGRCLDKDDLIQQTLGDLKGSIKDNRADILAAIIEGRCDVKDKIGALQGLLSGEFRDLSGKLCDLRHESAVQSFQTRVDIKDARCDIENKVDKSKDQIRTDIRDLKDDINDRFAKLRTSQLEEKIDDLRERLNRDRTVRDIFDRFREERHFRHEDHDHHRDMDRNFCWPRNWPTASVPAEVQAPLVAFAETDPCGTGGVIGSTKKS